LVEAEAKYSHIYREGAEVLNPYIIFGLPNQGRWDGRACSTHETEENACMLLLGKAEGKILLGRPSPRWEDSIKFILTAWDRRAWILFMWLGIDSSGGFL
jgi:hypothetical protein